MDIIKGELLEMKSVTVMPQNSDRSQRRRHHDEDMIPTKRWVITILSRYVKRTSLSEYRTQGRGGIGSKAAASKDDDLPSICL